MPANWHETNPNQSEHDHGYRGFEIRWPDLTVRIHRLVDRHFDTWLLTCMEASFKGYDLRTNNVAQAKIEALRLVVDRFIKIKAYAEHSLKQEEDSSD